MRATVSLGNLPWVRPLKLVLSPFRAPAVLFLLPVPLDNGTTGTPSKRGKSRSRELAEAAGKPRNPIRRRKLSLLQHFVACSQVHLTLLLVAVILSASVLQVAGELDCAARAKTSRYSREQILYAHHQGSLEPAARLAKALPTLPAGYC